jgi:hypothetical protein
MDMSSVEQLTELFNHSVTYVRSLLTIILISVLYISIIPSIYGPLEKMGVVTRLAENLPSSLGFFLFFIVLGETWRLVNLDLELAGLQGYLTRQAVAARSKPPPTQNPTA